MTRDTIKYMAVFAMLLNHMGMILLKPPLSEIFIDIGYFTAVVMCRFLVEGYQYTRSKKQYGLRLLLFALLSQIPYSLAFPENRILSVRELNMLFNLFFCFLLIHVYYTCFEPEKRGLYMSLLVMACFFCDWSCMAPAFVLLFLWAGDKREREYKAWIFSVLIIVVPHFLYYLDKCSGPELLWRTLGTAAGPAAAAVCILFLYNGRKSERLPRFNKWFFYCFYPAHLLILGLFGQLTK